MIIILSNIFGNYEALKIFNASIKNIKYSKIYCLGDVLSYGLNPFECFKYANEKIDIILPATDVNIFYKSRSAIFSQNDHIIWTREQSFPKFSENDWETFSTKWFFQYHTFNKNNDVYINNFKTNLHEYMFFRTALDIVDIFKRFQENTCFLGAMNFPGVLTETGEFYSANCLNYEFDINSIKGKKVIFTGSIGWPLKSGQICYITYKDLKVKWITKKYNISDVANKIKNKNLCYPSEEFMLWGSSEKEFLKMENLASSTKVIKFN